MSHPTLIAGHQLAGRYRILRAIGSGGYGAVYEALRQDSGARVALKVLHGAVAAEAVERKRFRLEARMMAELRHRHIVQVLDTGEGAEGEPYIALELLAGRSLRDELKRSGPRSAEWVAQWTRQTLAALDHAHQRDMVHRDLKPHNLFMCDGQAVAPFVKVLDFGIAKMVGGGAAAHTRLTATGAVLGTPQYMAPEQVHGEEVGPAADLYALGLIMAEALAGRRIVAGNDTIDILLTQASEQPVLLPEVVTESLLGPIVLRAVQKNLAHRYESAATMAAELDRLQWSPTQTHGVPSELENRPPAPPSHGQLLPAATAATAPPVAAQPLSPPSAPTAAMQAMHEPGAAATWPGAAPQPLPAPQWAHGPPKKRFPWTAVLLVALALVLGFGVAGGILGAWLLTSDKPRARQPTRSPRAGAKAANGPLAELSIPRLNRILRNHGWRVVETTLGAGDTAVGIDTVTAKRGSATCGVSLMQFAGAVNAKAASEAMDESQDLAIHVEGRGLVTVGCVNGDSAALLKVVLGNIR